MPYTSTDFFRDGVTETAETASEYFQLLWEGWRPNGPTPIPERGPTSPAYLADIDLEDEDSIFRQRVDGMYVNTISPKNYGAIGDNSTDDKVALQAAVTAAASFGITVDLRGLTYRTTDAVTLPTGAKFVNGSIRCTGTGKKIVEVTGDNVTVADLSITGRHAGAVASASEYGIYAGGASAASPLRNLTIKNVKITKVGQYGTFLKWVDGFRVIDSDLSMFGYMAIGTSSAVNGAIINNLIDTVLAGFSGNGYGIALSRTETNSLVTDPRSSKIIVANNRVYNVAWEGIDTHGGEHLTITNNMVLGCFVGIAIVGSDNASNVTTWAAQNVVISGNLIDALVTDGSAGAGIVFTGAGTVVGTPVQTATGSVTGNTIRNHGNQSNTLNGGIYVHNTMGVSITGNAIINPSPNGICLYHDNYGIIVGFNTIIDVWSTVVTAASAINIPSSYQTGLIMGNVLRNHGTKSGAVFKNERGYNAAGTTGVVLEAHGNSFADATLPVVGTTATRTSFNFKTFFGTQAAFTGAVGAPGVSFGTDTASGFYPIGTSDFGLAMAGVRKLRFGATAVTWEDGHNFSFAVTTGTKIGTGATQKIGFWGVTPVVQPAANADTSGATLANLEIEVNQLKALLRSIGLLAP